MENSFFNKNKVLSINLIYIASIIPIIIYSFIKNGVLVAKAGYLNWILALQYIIIPLVIIILSYVFETYYYLCIKKENDMHSVFNSLSPYANALCYLVCGPNNALWLTIPLIVFLDVLLKFIDNKVSVNQVALFKCLLFIFLTLMGATSNANLLEEVSELVTNPLDLFFGSGIGEIGITSSLFALIGFIILLFNSYYKKDVPICVLLSYAFVSIVLYFASSMSFNDVLINTFNSGIIFIAIFVASLSNGTSVVKSGRILYSVILGVGSAVFIHLIEFNMGVYILILVLSLLTPLFNKFKISLD